MVAAAPAALDPAFSLHGQAVTTQPAGQLVVVNGPVREAVGLNRCTSPPPGCAAARRPPSSRAADPAAQVPKRASPEAIVLIVAGGEAGRYSGVLGPCTGMGSQIVSRQAGSPRPLTT